MLRTGATRAVVRSFRQPVTAHHANSFHVQFTSLARPLSRRRLAPIEPSTAVFRKYAAKSSGPPYDKIDVKAEERVQKQILRPEPELVSTQSSVRGALGAGHTAQDAQSADTDMMAGVKADLKTVKETFELTEVPREAYNLGLAGVVPYLVTSLTTSYLAYDINHAYHGGMGVLLDGKTAETLLHLLEPIQVGYGAVILSFLGAIHWGLEFAGYGGHHGYKRYAIGVIAPAVAWPTIFLPVDYALISQFLAFNFLYFIDARTTTSGWSPPWYSIYRFVLTFIVGGSIAVSLVGRGQIADKVGTIPGPAQKMKELRDQQWENLEKEEEDREKKAKEESQDDKQ